MDGDAKLEAISYAAGTAAVFMACFCRAVVVYASVHWRVWVFLALNLLFLAILLTSKSQTPCFGRGELLREVEENDEGDGDVDNEDGDADNEDGDADNEDGDEDNEDGLPREELHRRVEAFIAMFRQHLVSDGAQTRR